MIAFQSSRPVAVLTRAVLGDVAELWENSIGEVITAHADALRAEAAFGADRYLRVWGNHDDRWMVLQEGALRDLVAQLPEAPEPDVASGPF